MTFYYVTNILDLHTFDYETTALLKFSEFSTEMHCFFIFFEWKKYYNLTFRRGGVIFKVEGLNYLVSKEAPPWLGPMSIENFSKLDPLDWLQLTPNSEIFHSKAFIKQEFVEIKKRICNVIKIWYFQKSPIIK